MIILPMGLKAKTQKVPVTTLLLAVITVAVSLFFWGFPHAYSVFVSNEVSQLNYELEYRSSALAKCHGHLEPKHCASISKILSQDSPRNFSQVQSEVNQALPASVPQDKVMEILKFLSDKFPPILESPQLASLKVQRDQVFEQYQKAEQVLTASHVTLTSLLKAQFTHDGFFHLFFNLIFLFGFAAFVEQRIGSLGFLAVYLISGFTGLLLQTAFSNWEHGHILGASANIFGVAGAFTALFFRHKMNLLFSAFFVLFRKVELNALAYVAFFVLVTEVTGLLETGLGGVAHWAHMGGFVSGALIATSVSWKQKIPHPLAFPYEMRLLEKARKFPGERESINILLWLLSQNPANHLALEELLKSSQVRALPWSDWNEHQQKVFSDSLTELETLKHQLPKGTWEKLVREIPESWPRATGPISAEAAS